MLKGILKSIWRFLVGSVVRKHVFFFSLLLLLLFGNFLIVVSPQNSLKHDALVIDVAGRQRMLSQRMAFYAEEIIHGDTYAKVKLKELVDIYDASLNALRNGGPVPAYSEEVPATKEEILPFLNGAEEEWKGYKKAILTLIEGPESDGQLTLEAVEAINYIEEHVAIILQKNDDLVKAYVTRSEMKQRVILYSLRISLMLSAIIVVVGYLWGKHSVLKPTQELHRATERMKSGDFRIRVQIKTGDEFEDLGNSFNDALSKLETLEEERRKIDRAKTAFLSVTSHELRSPMTPMKAQLEMLTEGYFGELNPDQKHALDVVLRNTEHLDLLIGDLVDVSRMGAGRLTFNLVKSDLTKEVKGIVHDAGQFEKDKQVKIHLKLETLPFVVTDPSRVMQVLRNLLNNAIKFSKPRGKVELFVQDRKNGILFSIRDYGIGISKGAQPHIFKAFFQENKEFNRDHPGSGLGLIICKGIVTALGGKIWFESTKGKGSTFYFTIPKVPPQDSQPAKSLVQFLVMEKV